MIPNLAMLLVVAVLFIPGALLIHFRKKPDQATRWKKYIVYFLLVAVIFYLIAINKLIIAAVIIGIKGFDELRVAAAKGERKLKWYTQVISVIFYGLVAAGFLFFSAKTATNEQWIVYGAVVVFDGISQLAGQWFGKTHFVPGISPNKTLEGFLTGWVFALGACFISAGFDTPYLWMYICIGPVALAGDLLASKYKRLCGIKDYDTLLPGHGGVLDRFDGLMLVGACWWVTEVLMLVL